MTTPPLKSLVAPFKQPSALRASWQITNSVGVYIALWCAMAWAITVSWWLTIPLAVFAGMMLVRVFIIFHDCGHSSFFKSRKANSFWGNVTGILAFTPYEDWRGAHAVHHGSTGNLDKRGVGDVWTMTVKEYQEASLWSRLRYRIARNPIVLLGVAPLLMFVFAHRIPSARATAREKRSVWTTTAAIVLIGTGLSFVFGFLTYLILQLIVIAIAGAIGIWLFYSQHQFDGAYWQRGEAWSYEEAAMRGSAFLRLPKVLQWLTGNIGFHHIHHLDSRIPNYNLQACHESNPLFQQVSHLTIFRSLRAFGLKLWDEETGKLIHFRQLRRRPRGVA